MSLYLWWERSSVNGSQRLGEGPAAEEIETRVFEYLLKTGTRLKGQNYIHSTQKEQIWSIQEKLA